ncbi:MAG TPA: protein-disulfide reductase DsbD N-terminal domain-containing protein [Pyrinomonadaceae bacterium]|nr:protein-disulfide reductase DsbD N-terminal domain-containing protein [Pyrinomonadaceae bacterium]
MRIKAALAACALALAGCSGGSGEGARTANSSAGPAASPSVSASASPGLLSAEGRTPPAEVVRASASPVEASAGGRAEASVRLEIAEGYHINANPPTHSYLIPTQVELSAEPGVTAGKPAYPEPLKKKFSFDPQQLAVYEKEATVKLPLSVDASATKGARTLRARVRVQPCDDQACYPPRTVETTLELNVK